MDKLRAMATFVQIVERGSLTAAADALDASLPAVVRTLAALETELGARLLNRTTRRLALTDEGRDYFERCKQVLAAVNEAEAALSARRRAPQGRLRVTAPVVFGRLHVAPVLTALLLEHPALQIELVLLDRVVDLIEEGFDAAVRIGRLPDSSLVAVPVGSTRRVWCASPVYLKRAGTPNSPSELAKHRCLSASGLALGQEWIFGGSGRQARITVKPALVSNQVEVIRDACEQGAGIGLFLSYQVHELLARGRLKRVLRTFEPEAAPIQLVYPQTRLLSSNVRAFVDWAVPRLKARLPPSD